MKTSSKLPSKSRFRLAPRLARGGDLLPGVSGPVGMPSISPQRRHGKIVGYSVYLGSVGNERRARRFFPQRRAAERFLAQQTTTPVPVGELWERKAELLYAMERLRPLGTNLADVVSFYLSHHMSPPISLDTG